MSPASVTFEIIVIGIQFLIVFGLYIWMFLGYGWLNELKEWIPVLSIGIIGASYTIGIIEQYAIIAILRPLRQRIRGKTLEKLSHVFSTASVKEHVLLDVMLESPESYYYLNQLLNQCRLLVATTANFLLCFPVLIIYFCRIRFNFYASVGFVLIFIGFALFLSHTSKTFYIYFTQKQGLIYMKVKGKEGENLTGGKQDAEKKKWWEVLFLN